MENGERAQTSYTKLYITILVYPFMKEVYAEIAELRRFSEAIASFMRKNNSIDIRVICFD